MKKRIKQRLLNAVGEQRFFVCDGTILANLVELRDALRKMSPGTFSCHIGKGKNDFAKWIEEVLEDRQLARSLQKVKTLPTCLNKVEWRLDDYSY